MIRGIWCLGAVRAGLRHQIFSQTSMEAVRHKQDFERKQQGSRTKCAQHFGGDTTSGGAIITCLAFEVGCGGGGHIYIYIYVYIYIYIFMHVCAHRSTYVSMHVCR